MWSIALPLTAACRGSVAAALARTAEVGADGRPFAADATHILLASDTCAAADLLAAADSLLQGGEGGYVFIELLCLDYHAVLSSGATGCAGFSRSLAPCAPPLWIQRKLAPRLACLATAAPDGHVSILLSPWRDAAALQRWPYAMQIKHALAAGAKKIAPCKLRLVASASELRALDAQLVEDPQSVLSAFSSSDPAEATARLASVASGVGASGGGTPSSSGTAAQQAATLFRAAVGSPSAVAAALRERVLDSWLLERMEFVVGTLVGEARGKTNLLPMLAEMLIRQEKESNMVRAQPLLAEISALTDAAMGEEAEASTQAAARLAYCMMRQGKAVEAEPLWRRQHEAYARTAHPGTERALDTLIDCLLMQPTHAKKEEALLLLREASSQKRDKHGASHDETLRALHNLSCCLGQLGEAKAKAGDVSVGEAMVREAMDIRRSLPPAVTR